MEKRKACIAPVRNIQLPALAMRPEFLNQITIQEGFCQESEYYKMTT